MQYILDEVEMESFRFRMPKAQELKLRGEAIEIGRILIEQIGCAKTQMMGYCDDCPLANAYDHCKQSRDFSQ